MDVNSTLGYCSSFPSWGWPVVNLQSESEHDFIAKFVIIIVLFIQTNSFQVILTTDGSKSYVIFTYNCSSMNWAVTPTIGYNAGGTKWENHYLTGFNYAYLIGCVHDDTSSDINNIIYDLVPQPDSVLSSQANPPFNPTIGRFKQNTFPLQVSPPLPSTRILCSC